MALPRFKQPRRCLALVRLLFLCALLCLARSRALAISFNLSYDASVASAPVGFMPAFEDAIQFYEVNFTDPITINLQVGFGEVAGQSLIPSALGESSASMPGFFHFDQIKSVLVSDAKSAVDLLSIANMPATDPTAGATFKLSRANSRALGLIAGDAAGMDGSVGFDNTAAFTYDPNHRAVAGKFDFIGIAEHEISEVMGRFGIGQNGAPSGRYSPLDFFRYTALGVLDLAPTNGAYFSIDGGKSSINTFNGPGGGDLSDWAGATIDAYNAAVVPGVMLPLSAGDLTAMDVIGYDRLIPSDFNRDGLIDAFDVQAMMVAMSDLNTYQSAKNLTAPQLELLADLNGDGQITNSDIQSLIALIANNEAAGNSSTAVVPEPSALLLTMAAIGCIASGLPVRPSSPRRKSGDFGGNSSPVLKVIESENGLKVAA